MALFDVGAIPKSSLPDRQSIDALVSEERLISLPTGGDGGYLLHLYVDEEVPEHVQRHYEADDRLMGHFTTADGRIAFGGAESAFADFPPNQYIRSDTTIEPGRYAYAAYKTEFPDDLVEKAIRVERSRLEWWARRAPMFSVLLAIALVPWLAATRYFIWAGLVAALCVVAYRWFRSRPMYRDIVTRQDEAQLDFPSIVIEMRSSLR